MLSTEREGFEHQLGVLCAGFNVAVTTERIDAYWRGLAKMGLAAFERVVEFALGETGPEKIPIPRQCWLVHRRLRSAQRVAEQAPVQMDFEPPSVLVMHAQRVLLSFLRHQRGGTSQASLLAMIAAKNLLVEQYRCIVAGPPEDPEAAAELRDRLTDAFAAVFEPMPKPELERHQSTFIASGNCSNFSDDERSQLQVHTQQLRQQYQTTSNLRT